MKKLFSFMSGGRKAVFTFVLFVFIISLLAYRQHDSNLSPQAILYFESSDVAGEDSRKTFCFSHDKCPETSTHKVLNCPDGEHFNADFTKYLNSIFVAHVLDQDGFESLDSLQNVFENHPEHCVLSNEFCLFRALPSERKQSFIEARLLIQKAKSLPASLGENYLKQALRRYENLGAVQGQIATHIAIGAIRFKSWNFSKSIESFQKAHDLAEEGQYLFYETLSSIYTGKACYYLRDYDSSLHWIETSLGLVDSLGNKKLELDARLILSRIYYETGDLSSALDALTLCTEISQSQADRPKLGAIKRLTGFILSDAGEFEQAIKEHEASLGFFQKIQNNLQQGAQYTNIGNNYLYLGRYDQALRFQEKALRMFKRHGKSANIAEALANKGEVFAQIGKVDSALHYFETALTFEGGDDLEKRRAETRLMLARALLKQNRPKKALPLLQEIIQLSEQSGLQIARLQSNLAMGECKLMLQDAHGALSNYDRALEIATFSENMNYEHWRALHGKAKAQRELGKNQLALLAFEQATKYVEQWRGQIKSGISRTAYFAEKQSLYEDYIEAILASNAPDVARSTLEVSERFKGRTLHDFLVGEVNIEDRESLTSEKVRKETQINFSDSSLVVDTSQIQQELSTDEILVMYQILPRETIIWTLTTESVDMYRTDGPKDVLDSLVREFRISIGAEQKDRFQEEVNKNSKGVFEHSTSVGRELSALLIDPVWHRIKPYKTVYLIPDGSLHYLPFAALPLTKSVSKNSFLVEELPFAFVSSAKAFLHSKTAVFNMTDAGGQMQGDLLAIVDPNQDLQWMTEIGEKAIDIFPASRLLRGNDANLDSVREHLKNDYRFLFFGLHCQVNERDPLETKFLLNSDSKDLMMHHVMELKFQKTRLAILAACQTGVGKHYHGEGLVGLTHAFRTAGAPSLVATLWDVDQKATAILMEKALKNIQAGFSSFAEALREAQVSEIKRLRESSTLKQPHPYFWAPFILIGYAENLPLNNLMFD